MCFCDFDFIELRVLGGFMEYFNVTELFLVVGDGRASQLQCLCRSCFLVWSCCIPDFEIVEFDLPLCLSSVCCLRIFQDYMFGRRGTLCRLLPRKLKEFLSLYSSFFKWSSVRFLAFFLAVLLLFFLLLASLSFHSSKHI